jgi:hypothetical protein
LLEDEERSDLDYCEKDFAVLGDHDLVSKVGVETIFILYNLYKNHSHVPRL